MKVRMVVFLCVGPVPTRKIQLGLGMCYKENIPKTDKRQLYLLESAAATEQEAWYSLVRPPVCHGYFIYFEMKIILL